MSPVVYDVEMHEDDDFQKTLDMADESKPKKVWVNFALTLRSNFRQKHFVIYLHHFFYSLHEDQFKDIKKKVICIFNQDSFYG